MSCGVSKKTYMCGDRACVNNKEFKEYFAENLIIEIKKKKTKENSRVDLVKINTNKITKSKTQKNLEKQKYRSKKKEEKIILRAEKKKLEEERKNTIIKKKNKIKEEKKLVKLNKKKKKEKKTLNTMKTSVNIKNQLNENKAKKSNLLSDINPINQSSLCGNIKDCDIDKITELLIKKGREKNFPDITSK